MGAGRAKSLARALNWRYGSWFSKGSTLTKDHQPGGGQGAQRSPCQYVCYYLTYLAVKIRPDLLTYPLNLVRASLQTGPRANWSGVRYLYKRVDFGHSAIGPFSAVLSGQRERLELGRLRSVRYLNPDL